MFYRCFRLLQSKRYVALVEEFLRFAEKRRGHVLSEVCAISWHMSLEFVQNIFLHFSVHLQLCVGCLSRIYQCTTLLYFWCDACFRIYSAPRTNFLKSSRRGRWIKAKVFLTLWSNSFVAVITFTRRNLYQYSNVDNIKGSYIVCESIIKNRQISLTK